MSKLVSIVLPVYNGQKYLAQSIESVLAQTYKNWELLILDDCSTDATSIIAQKYIKRDKRIKYFHNEHNLRLPRNLNKGFKLAQGDFLTWTSDDNLYKISAIEKMVRTLSYNNIDFVFASYQIIDEYGKKLEDIIVSEDSKDGIIGGNPVGACFMYSRRVYEYVGEYDPDLTLVEDFDYWQRIMSHFKTAVLPEVLYGYRRHSGALTSTMDKTEFFVNLEKMLLKNRDYFDHLTLEQHWIYYKTLFFCAQKLGKKDLQNPYKKMYYPLFIWWFIFRRIPYIFQRIPYKIFGFKKTTDSK